MANTTSIINFYNKALVKAYSKLRVESIHKTWNNMFISTNSITPVVVESDWAVAEKDC